MKVSCNWLREYVDFDLSPTELADLLTMAGLEVEGIEEVGAALEGVVVGEVVSLLPHPQADRLSLCRVQAGEKAYPIVCGARNMRAGDKVALALEGAQLPGGVEIKRTKIRGELSEGMLCSEAELGFSASADGIMILPAHAPSGTPLADFLNIRDTLLEISLTPNRGDCLSMIGIAREVAALTGTALHVPISELREGRDSVEAFVRVSVRDLDLCPRYSARLITGVQIGPSPFWLRTRLERAGVRAINNVVDVTNYVMLEYGQPLHAFDHDFLEGGGIVVKRAASGEHFVTLDGVERQLNNDTLMICDAAKPIAIGGIMGGVNSEIRESTSRVLLESAYFTPVGIRRTSTALGLQTESSYRFERGVDPEGVLAASRRATSLIAELAGGEVAQGVIDCCPVPVPRPEITVRLPRANALLGLQLEQEEVRGILQRLNIEIKEHRGDTWKVVPPSYRGDITREIDLIEEIGRLHGYDRIPVETPLMSILPGQQSSRTALIDLVTDTLVGLGFYEAITYSFISPQSLQSLCLPPDDPLLHPLVLRNPLAEAQSVMRTTLLPGLLETVRYNLSHTNRDIKIFEARTIYCPRAGDKLPAERQVLAGVIIGATAGHGWNSPRQEVDFFYTKGCVERILAELHTPSPTFTGSERIAYVHPGKGAAVQILDKAIGLVGELHPHVAEAFGLPAGVFIFELDLAALSDGYLQAITFTPLPRFPSVARDVAVAVDERITADELTRMIREVDTTAIESVEIFDSYQGDPIPAGRKGLAFRIQYRSLERTLTDEEVNGFHQKVLERLARIPELVIR
jgi:phenylalanyl-tRNA synthetase beta chain